MYRLVILLLFYFYIPASFAQSNYTVRSYSTENGLPSNGIKGIQWDTATGFLWIATEAGVVRFNGIDFKTFTKENMPGLSSERMLFLCRNYQGKILTSDQVANVFEVEKNKLIFKNHYKQRGKNLFLVAASSGLLQHNLYIDNQLNYGLPFDRVIQLNDTACYLQRSNSLVYYSFSQERIINFPLIRSRVQYFFKIGDNYFLKDTANRLYLFNTKNETISPVNIKGENGQSLNLNQVDHTLYWENGMKQPILFSGNKAWKLEGDQNGIFAKLIAEGIPENAFIRFVQYDEKQNILFIGTDSKGIIVVSRNKVTLLRKKNPGIKERNAYYGQVELDNGDVVTNEGHIIGTSGKKITDLPIEGSFVLSVFRTGDSLLWYAKDPMSAKGSILHYYNYRTKQTKVYPKIILGSFALCSSNEKVYIVDGNGIYQLDGDSLLKLNNYHFNGGSIYDMQETEPGILLIASCDGLMKYDIASNRIDVVYREGNYCVRSIWKYKDYIFFGTYGNGFFMMKNGTIKAMPLDKNKYLLYTHCFIPDDEGFCWISTNRGLFKASLNELLNAFDHSVEHIYYHYFGKNDGMDITEMNGGCVPCALRLRNKELSFPTMDGLLQVDPAKAEAFLPGGQIYIDEFRADDKTIDPDSIASKSLSAKTSEILIRLGYSTWCNKENIYIDYQLGDTTVWRPLTDESQALLRFNNLPSGNYILRFRKLNGFGINNYTYKEIRFTIKTPWYRQTWFYFLAVAAALGIVLLIFQIRLQQHKKQQKKLELQVAEKTKELQEKNEVLEKADSIKTRLISIISHDIITPLKFLGAAGKNLLDKRKHMPEDLQHETIQEMTNTSLELQLLSTNILNWIKYQNENRRLLKEDFNLCELVDSVFSILKSMAAQKNIALVNDVDREMVIHQYYEPLKILVYNLVTNAINFSDRGTITVAAKKETNRIKLWVKDEGVGMTVEQVNNILSKEFIISSTNVDNRKGNGLGYLIIKDLVKMMSASLDIQSDKNKGTKVSISMRENKKELAIETQRRS